MKSSREVREAATLAERERIIKLLESERWPLLNGLSGVVEIYLPLEQAIALIKGETE